MQKYNNCVNNKIKFIIGFNELACKLNPVIMS